MLQPLNVTILFAVSKMTPPVPVDPAGHTHRVLLTSNQKLEVVGDEDFRFVQERDSEMVKTARRYWPPHRYTKCGSFPSRHLVAVP